MKRSTATAARCSTLVGALLAMAAVLGAGAARAQVITIDQAKALAGNVTPGDAPGFPVTISQPGHYRLTGNLTVADPNAHGIEVTSSGGVRIDLSGFTIRGARCGPVRCTIDPPAADGVHDAKGGRMSLHVHDGRIENFGGHGLYGGRLLAERLTVIDNGRFGIAGNGPSLVSDSHVAHNLQTGVALLSGIARGNVVVRNGTSQLQASNGSVLVTGNTLLGVNPLDGAGTAGPISLGDNVCAPQGHAGQRC